MCFVPVKCPECGLSDKLNKAGLCNFRWINGDWVRQRSSEFTAETDLITCDRCAVTYDEYTGIEHKHGITGGPRQ